MMLHNVLAIHECTTQLHSYMCHKGMLSIKWQSFADVVNLLRMEEPTWKPMYWFGCTSDTISHLWYWNTLERGTHCDVACHVPYNINLFQANCQPAGSVKSTCHPTNCKWSSTRQADWYSIHPRCDYVKENQSLAGCCFLMETARGAQNGCCLLCRSGRLCQRVPQQTCAQKMSFQEALITQSFLSPPMSWQINTSINLTQHPNDIQEFHGMAIKTECPSNKLQTDWNRVPSLGKVDRTFFHPLS